MKRVADDDNLAATTDHKRVKLDLTVDGEQDDDAQTLDREIQDIINGPVTPPPNDIVAVDAAATAFKPSPSQQRALEAVRAGKNVFITGNAGSGKSALLDAIMRELRALNKRYVLTASTGVAAWNIGGVTTHSFAGMGLANQDIGVYTAGMRYKPDKRREWEELDVLIVDEISMLSVDFMQKLDAMAKFCRAKTAWLPFGGLQLVLTGDYFQCPSVEKDFEEFDPVTGEARARFPFQAPLWQQAHIESIVLRENFRQQGDLAFFALLERVKVAKHTLYDEELLETRLLERHPQVNATDLIKLCSRRATANAINTEELHKIPAPPHRFTAVEVKYDAKGHPIKPSGGDGGANDNGPKERYPVDAQLTLKVGAEVLLCVNMTQLGLFNGSRGRVVDFRKDPLAPRDATLWPYVEFENGGDSGAPLSLLVTPNRWEQLKKGRLASTFTQVPLILRYAITVHKAQGLTLSKVLVMMDFFENGQGYVALSRVRSLADLYLANVDMATIKASPAVVDFYTSNNLIDIVTDGKKRASVDIEMIDDREKKRSKNV